MRLLVGREVKELMAVFLVKMKLKKIFYDIVVGSNIVHEIGLRLKKLNIGQDAVIITNPAIQKWYGPSVSAGLKRANISTKIFNVPDGEESKSADMAFRCLNQIAAYDVKKKIFIIAMGGGVVGDLAGFVASCYKRGVPYIQLPTSFLAQIDSAIGGKVGIDLAMGKNLAGAFYQPRLVFSDVALLKTLDERQIRNGLAEAIKYGVIDDKNLFEYLEKNYKALLMKDLKCLQTIVARCSQIKANVVMKDEREIKGIRTILNFGHTVGHAIEAASQYRRYQHGEAIALGMRIAADLSQRMGLLSEKKRMRLEQLITAVGLPVDLKGVKLSRILQLMQHDKKFVAGKNRFVLAYDIGGVKVVEGIPLLLIQQAIRARTK